MRAGDERLERAEDDDDERQHVDEEDGLLGEVDQPFLHARSRPPVDSGPGMAPGSDLWAGPVPASQGQCPAPLAASGIFSIAWSMVKVFGFWTGGNSLKVSRNFPTI